MVKQIFHKDQFTAIGLLSMHFVFRKNHPILSSWNNAMISNQPFMESLLYISRKIDNYELIQKFH